MERGSGGGWGLAEQRAGAARSRGVMIKAAVTLTSFIALLGRLAITARTVKAQLDTVACLPIGR